MPPTPTGSPVPRANTASTSEHGCAELIAIGAQNKPPTITNAVLRTRPIWLRRMIPIVAYGTRTCRSEVTDAAFSRNGLRCLTRIVENTDGDAVRQETDFAGRVGVVLVCTQRMELGGVHLLDTGAAVGTDRVDRPHPVTGFAGGFRPGPGAPRQVLEHRRPPGPIRGHGEEPADSLERVAKSLGRVADHMLEVFRIESEPTVVIHCGLLAAHTKPPGRA